MGQPYRHRVFNSFLSLLLLLCIWIDPAVAASPSEKKAFHSIKHAFHTNKIYKGRKLAKSFFRTFPRSNYVADVRLFLADHESSPWNALKQYRIIIKNYRFFRENAKVQARICAIYALKGDWKNLYKEANIGNKKYSSSTQIDLFNSYVVQAQLKLTLYESANASSNRSIKGNRRPKRLGEQILLRAQTEKKISGYSRSYLYSLRELALHHRNSSVFPTALYLLGSFYLYHKDYNRAFSAYSDVRRLFPRSPEAMYAQKCLQPLLSHNPHYISYIPVEKTILKTPSIDISPEISLDQKKGKRVAFALSVGPFTRLSRARDLKKILSAFGKARLIKIQKGYVLYTGSYSTVNRALRSRIRLAEEYGINANIVRIAKGDRKEYIYGDN